MSNSSIIVLWPINLGTTYAAWYNAAVMPQSSQPVPTRLLVIGLDGATWTIARPLMEAGRMPNLARLVTAGTAGPLASTVPPISAAAWVTFLTGQNPGRHGVYQFRRLDLSQYSGYSDRLTSSLDYAGSSFLEMAGQRGLRVGAVGIPMTYPPFPVNGFLVSGFPRPFGPKAQVYPPEMAAQLGRWDEMPDNFNFSLSPEKTVEAADFWVRKYTDIALEALAREPFDLFLIVWNSTDNIPHLYWKYTDPAFPAYDAAGASQFGDVINHQYEMADREIGRLLEALPSDGRTSVLVMSDHGMGPYPHRQVHLNAWLAAQGLLSPVAGASDKPGLINRTISALREQMPTEWRVRLRDRLPAGVKAGLFARHMNLNRVDWASTRAYRMKVFPTVEGIVVNLHGRQEQGIVEPGAAYEALRTRILGCLADLRDPVTGDPIVERASRREDLFSGPHLDEIPDILVELHEAYTGGALFAGPLVTPMSLDDLSDYSATHRPTGLFVFSGPGIRQGAWLEGSHIVDLAPTLMHWLGLPVAAAMDGSVLSDLWEPAALRTPEYADYAAGQPAENGGLTSEEETAIREQLAGLGYL